MVASVAFVHKTLENRAKNVLKSFVQDKYSNINFILKMRYFIGKVYKVQKKLRDFHSSNRIRHELLTI